MMSLENLRLRTQIKIKSHSLNQDYPFDELVNPFQTVINKELILVKSYQQNGVTGSINQGTCKTTILCNSLSNYSKC